ncbi:MAG: adenylate/guanylate cyclase domain-containing protein [Treponema sp.]|nr:adenylate/guanylate cyclase domain-containing protein [Treponema sp.]
MGAKSAVLSRPFQAAIAGLVGVALSAALWLTGALDPFEARTWDMRERLFARPGAATHQIVTILLDQASLDWVQNTDGLGWPWPRELYSAVVDFCRRGGAKALVFDVLLTEPSTYGVSDDQRLADALRSNGTTVGAMLLGSKMADAESWPKEVPTPGIAIDGFDSWMARERPRQIGFPRAQFPLPEVASAFAMLANTNLPPDASDGVYRREPLFARFDGQVLPSEALAAYLVGEGGEHRLAIRPGTLVVDGKRVPIDSNGRAILRFRGPTLTYPNYSAQAVLQSEQQILEGKSVNLDPSVLKGAYVFFGFTASGLFDLKPTPMSGSYPGVEINATMLDNLLSADFERPLSPLIALLLIVLLAAAASFAVMSASGAAGNAIVYLVAIPVAPALSLGAYALGWWMPVVAAELAVLVSLVGSSLLNYATEGRQKRYIKGAFRQYLSPTVIEELIAHPERLELGGEKRELTIFFSDIQGFTSISETLGPEELTALLNDYLTAMVDIIQEEGGTIDKFEGDAIIAFWNAPLDLGDHAVRGVRASLRCQSALAELRPAFRARVGKDMYMRVGLNSGPAVVGNMGSRTRFDYTMLGDAVNLASRLEGVNKQFGTYTMISEATLRLLGGAFPARELSRIAVVGRKEPVTVFEPMQPEEFEARRPILEAFGRALALYYTGDFAAARAVFESTADRDPPAARYAERCRELEAAPPPAGEWSGVWVMTSK